VASRWGKNHSKVPDALSKNKTCGWKEITMKAMRDKVHRVAHPGNVLMWSSG
jgi:hypothetical protein